MAQEREPLVLAVLEAQAREFAFGEPAVRLGNLAVLAHARASWMTLATPSVGQTPQPTQDVRVQSGVVTPWAARRHSLWRKPLETPGEVPGKARIEREGLAGDVGEVKAAVGCSLLP